MKAITLACLFAAGALASSACSSVPSIHFVDDLDGGERDGSSDGGAAAPPPPEYACPKEPPPGAICCGTKICMNCAPTDCGDCACEGTTDSLCCKKSNGMMQCKTLTACQ